MVASVALAIFGTVVLVGYVQGAHDRATASEVTTSVLVVTSKVAKGTRAADLADKVDRKDVPEHTKVDGAVSNIAELSGKVAATDLLPGEQVLSDRFEIAQALGRAGVPKGLLEVTVQLDADRALGGAIKAGDTVAVLSSFAPFELDAAGQPAAPGGPQKTPNSTHVMLHKVLVTNVQMTGAADSSKETTAVKDETSADPVPTGKVFVTFALDAPSVERVVFTAEYGTLWLSAEPSNAPEDGTRIQTRGSIYP